MTTETKTQADLSQSYFQLVNSLLKPFAVATDRSVPDASPPSRHFLAEMLAQVSEQQMTLWRGLLGGGAAAAAPTAAGDRRFSSAEWQQNPWFSLLAQTYLLNSNLFRQSVESLPVDEREKQRLRFFGQQFVDSMSPANFLATNPEALKEALGSNGETLRAGLTNLFDDLQRNRISITDERAFQVGQNVATAEGSIIFENELFQLIQYAPSTNEVAERPLLIVPPCINKYYILDLQPENSFVRYACEQGMTVFMMSWRNPDASLAKTTWDDYVENGAMKAIEVTRSICGTDKINTVGWCVGGTILSSALAVLRARGADPVASLTLLTTMLDFSEPGDLGVFVDEQMVSMREQTLSRGGLYSGKELGFVFQMLRANDLIWPYVVNNYLKGKTPQAFDLLYWNSDGTNLPGPMYAWYLRNAYLENKLCIPNAVTTCGTSLDFGTIDMPSYVLATIDDHIVPWKAAYRSTQLLGGKTEFVLGASGHIAGVINPASKNKRNHWVEGVLGENADKWLESASDVPGTWWVHWMNWLKPHAGKTVDARMQLGNADFNAIEPAPGRYVKVRAD